MNELDLSLEDYAVWREVTETQQYAMATNLVKMLSDMVPNFPKAVTGDVLLDALGCEGLSLIIGEYAGDTYRSRAKNGFPEDEA